ncbi:L-seryl-tRNA(Sec) selenium transferase [Candidatus Contubernalis alkaliaceticus]|uniref:L-seryl-tRNA(Sec) selenium transferase n=1 Tax=Candidatus Contubernalis alkaliaceticus TaxID=338645 RepID=UPI001F4C0C38|nr:L-seryl-tRNA(Sec) selenium transferase [Candidatus Contubernalis alkalaceticus]
MNDSIRQRYLRSLPGVDQILQCEYLLEIKGDYPQRVINDSVRETVSSLRAAIIQAESEEELLNIEVQVEQLAQRALEKAKEILKPNLCSVINATGTVLHTNLGRSLLAKKAVEAVSEVSRNYSNLELDLSTGERGSRYSHVEEMLCSLTGAQGAVVVNNNAAAVMLVLNTMAQSREVIISRGQLVEIGGSFRIPDVMSQSGAHLVEVGTTNKTHLRDYENAINDNTAMLLKVHTSNYHIVGFTSQVSGSELVELGRRYSLPAVEDLGSGVLIDLSKYGLMGEPTVQECVREGLDVVTFSGDKLLGGPQAGIIVGNEKYIQQVKKNQLTRALRIDKMTCAALEATLKLYMDEGQAVRQIPTLRMLTIPVQVLEYRASSLAAFLKEHLTGKVSIQVIDGYSQVGGGSLPLEKMPTKLVSLQPNRMVTTAEAVERLRREVVPVVARVHKNQLLIDVRTVLQEEIPLLQASLVRVFKKF